MTTHSQAFLRRRRFLLVLPLLVLPFLTMAFWALGGGRGLPNETPPPARGLNLQLPAPQLKEKGNGGKLGLYQQEQRRLQRAGVRDQESFLQGLGLPTPPEALLQTEAAHAGSGQAPEKSAEDRIQERLEQLSGIVSASPPPGELSSRLSARPAPAATQTDHRSGEVARLEALLQTRSGKPAPDPELQQLEGMLDRILDIQHPDRVKERLRAQPSPEGQLVVPVQVVRDRPEMTLLASDAATVPPSSGSLPPAGSAEGKSPGAGADAFHGLPAKLAEADAPAVEAVVHETQVLRTGATVKLRLLQDTSLGGTLFSRGSLLYGTCRLNGERLVLEVTSARTRNAILPVTLTAYDLDGLEGLAVPGSLLRDAARQGADRAIGRSLSISSLSPSIGGQAAGAGIEAAKGLLSRQARQVKVTVQAGHRLLLRDHRASH